jgi:hypothetical protein
MSASTGTTVTVLVAVLLVLGAAMIGVAVWLIRATRSDPPALGPLEVMGARQWRRGDADRRRTKLDTARPPGAAPPAAPVVAVDGNCEPSMQESAVSAHTSSVAPADLGPEAGDGDVDETPGSGIERAQPEEPANTDAAAAESAHSSESSPEESTGDAAVETNTTE